MRVSKSRNDLVDKAFFFSVVLRLARKFHVESFSKLSYASLNNNNPGCSSVSSLQIQRMVGEVGGGEKDPMCGTGLGEMIFTAPF